jgi:hypothetical protein
MRLGIHAYCKYTDTKHVNHKEESNANIKALKQGNRVIYVKLVKYRVICRPCTPVRTSVGSGSDSKVRVYRNTNDLPTSTWTHLNTCSL